MAVTELLLSIAHDYLTQASKANNAQASSLLQEAAKLSLRGDRAEAQLKSAQASELLGKSIKQAEGSKGIIEDVIPTIVEKFRVLGIEEPPIDYLSKVPLRGGSKEAVKPVREPTKKADPGNDLDKKPHGKTGKRGAISASSLQARFLPEGEDKVDLSKAEKRLVVSPNQYINARAGFRLLDESETDEVKLADSLKVFFPDIDYRKAYSKVTGTNRANLAIRLKAIGQHIGKVSREEVAFPLKEKQLAVLDFSPRTQDLFRRLGEAYPKMTLKEILDTTSGSEAVKVVLPKKKEVGNPEPTENTINELETYFLAKQILDSENDKLPNDDRLELEKVVANFERKTTDTPLSEVESELAKDSLARKLEAYSKDKAAIFDQQNETGQFLLSFVEDEA